MISPQQWAVIQLLRSALSGKAEELGEDFSLLTAMRLTNKHQVYPLLYVGALNCGVSQESMQMQGLFVHVCRVMALSEQQLFETNRLFAAFEEAKLDYMPLKGTLLKAYYPESHLRTMSDVDILIRTEQYSRIKPIMKELGFEEGVESDHEYHWKSGAVHIELHKRLIPSYNKDLYAYFGEGWEHAIPVEGSNFRYTFSKEAQYIYLFAHFAKHFRDGGIGIRHMTDLWVYYQAERPNVSLIQRELEKMGLAVFHRNVFTTCANWFGTAESSEMTDYITKFVFSSGAYGNEKAQLEAQAGNSGPKSGKRAKFRWQLRRLFLPYSQMCQKYPFLKYLPFLLPIMWVVRWFSALLFRGKSLKKELALDEKVSAEGIEEYWDGLHYVGLKAVSEGK